MFALPDHMVGGGYVRRKCCGRVTGEHLTRDEIMAIKLSNRRALISNGFIDVYPCPPGGAAERHVVNRGFGKFDVIEGRKVNNDPLSKEDAEALAGVKLA